MSAGHSLKIEGSGVSGRTYKVWLDGERLDGLSSLKLEMDVESANWVTLRLLVGSVEVGAEVVREERGT